MTRSARLAANDPGSLTEDAIALAFVRERGGDLRFCHHAGKWYVWTGSRWHKEETRLAFDWARRTCREINAAGDAVLAKAATAAAVERFAQADRVVAVTSAVWDVDPFLLGTPGGTVELKTGVLRPARQADFITRQTAVAPSKGATPLWQRFLEEVTLGDAELQRFLRQVAGYCLTGDVREHALFFVYGPGGNGKSVFLNVLAGVMGDYATTAAMDTFTASATDRHPTDLAMLQGARLVSASETEEGRAWAESRIKQMTGGDAIRARFMRQDFFEYRPQFKLVIGGNHKPVLRNVDDAARRRFNIIPFVHKPKSPDRQLEEKLKAEWPGILAWAIEGAIDWQQNGLVRPAVVSDATNEYFSEQDSVRQWIEEACETGRRSLCETTASLFAGWTAYAHANGEQPGTTKWFSQALQRLGYEPVRDTPGQRKKRGFLGISLKTIDTTGQWQNRSGQQ
jgi:putative DNA primase/helicase